MTLAELQRHLENGTLSVRELLNINAIQREGLLAQLPKKQAANITAALNKFLAWENK